MGTTSVTVGNDILSAAMFIHMNEWRDGLHLAFGFLDSQNRVHGKGQPSEDGGSRIIVPVGLAEHSSDTQLTTGYEEIDISVADGLRPAVYTWAHTVRPIAISGEEERLTGGSKTQVINLSKARTEMVANEMRRKFSKQMVSGNVTGWTNWNTLNGIDRSGGFLEEDAVGSQTNSIGGLSKSTYSTTQGWQNQLYDGAASFNANGLTGLYNLLTKIRARSPSGDPDIILASELGAINLKRALQANERYVSAKDLDGGKQVQMFDGIPVTVEPQMPISTATGGSSSNTNPMTFAVINSKDIYVLWDSEIGYFYLTEFEFISGKYDVRSAKMHCRGQLIAKLLGSSGLAVDLETF
jgi:hypothetical protein